MLCATSREDRVATSFNHLASRYQELWTQSPIGRLQRNASWRVMDGLFAADQRVLDLGCGTGEDTLHLAQAGVKVHAVDISPRMIQISRDRVHAQGLQHRVRLQHLGQSGLSGLLDEGPFDGVISNFGVVNCVNDLKQWAFDLSRMVRPGGCLLLCWMGRFCLWETLWYLGVARPSQAFRRLRVSGARASLVEGVTFRVFYPSAAKLVAAFPDCQPVYLGGIGVFVPPSCAQPLARTFPRLLTGLAHLDRRVAGWPGLRALSDHRLLLMVRR